MQTDFLPLTAIKDILLKSQIDIPVFIIFLIHVNKWHSCHKNTFLQNFNR